MSASEKNSDEAERRERARRRRLNALALADIGRTLKPGKGRGRPTDAAWVEQAKIPMTLETKRELEQLAAHVGVGYTQLAARLLERALASNRIAEARREIERANEQQHWPTKVSPTPAYYTKLMGLIYYNPSEEKLKRALEALDKADWLALYHDSAPESAAFRGIREISPGGRENAARFIEYLRSLLPPHLLTIAEEARAGTQVNAQGSAADDCPPAEAVRISEELLRR